MVAMSAAFRRFVFVGVVGMRIGSFDLWYRGQARLLRPRTRLAIPLYSEFLTSTTRSALICAWPAMLVATLVLIPFLQTPFTIDDPLYLREAQQVLEDPLHPQAFNMVWSLELNLRASQILPGGIFVPYLLIPTALAGYAEWVGHLTELVLLLAAVFATALAALRLGLDSTQARLAALLTAACPAVLGMAGTVMPDIPAMLLTILGIERIIAWRDQRKWHQAAAATCWLTLAALTRTHAILVLAPVFVFLLNGINAEEIRASFRNFPARFLPIVLTPVAFFAVSAITADPFSEGENILPSVMQRAGGLHLTAQNGLAFLAHWLLVIPLTIPWLLLRFRRIPFALQLVPLLGASLLSTRIGWVAFAAGATLMAMADILWDAIQRRDRVQLALWIWLFVAVPVVFYLHLPSKYLLPSVPAAALLVVRLLPEGGRGAERWLIPAVAVAGVILGVLILTGIRDLAETQKRAVAELVAPRIQPGERVWFSGHWGFQWYAEHAGASAATLEQPVPQRGETVVVSEIDFPFFARKWSDRTVLQRLCYPSSRWGRVMDFEDRAGFFSSPFGYLPWIWGSRESSCFEVWRIE